MTAQWMAFRQVGVIEIICGIVGHSQFFHHTARAQIRRHGKRNNLIKSERAEALSKRRACPFAGKPTAPMVGSQTPANFHSRHKVRIEGRNEESYETNK